MKREQISAVLGELADRHIEDALEYEQKDVAHGVGKRISKAAACVALVILGSFGVATAVFAANEDFRNAVIRFVSGFSDEEKTEIREGHLPASLDKEEVLIGFLHEFNDRNMGDGERAKYGENGFDYTVLDSNQESAEVIVTCDSEDVRLFVKMSGELVEEQVTGWKVASCQLIPSAQAQEMLASCGETAQITGQEPEEQGSPGDSLIEASEGHGKLYHALHKEKENIIDLTTRETEELRNLFAKYENDEAGWEGENYEYVIKLSDADYMITRDGYVVCENNNETIAFRLKSQDLDMVMGLFEKYSIPE